jgi:dTMP kinase
VFICFEGIDGAGKSTQARMLHERLQAQSVPVELVADPGTTRVGKAIREILLDNEAPIAPAAQMLLFSAARAELAAYISAQLKDGVTVICDRWLLSTLVYQGEINRIPADLILQIFKETSRISPDLCFLLEISPEESRARIGEPRDRYERRCGADQDRMCAAYARYAATVPEVACKVHSISANAATPEETHAHVYSLWRQYFDSKAQFLKDLF